MLPLGPLWVVDSLLQALEIFAYNVRLIGGLRDAVELSAITGRCLLSANHCGTYTKHRLTLTLVRDCGVARLESVPAAFVIVYQ